MTDSDFARERRKQRRLEQLGTNEPKCATCGEGDWRCLELHHVADFGCDETTVIVCRNCHRRRSDEQKDHPAFDPNADASLHAIGRFLLGLADMLRAIIDRLYEFGRALIERAAPTGDAI
ncbi:HNH endonuclease [Sphingomonas antarctica]|uniref:hypothetical protein n=1 Tax=Sphingomonas antarctica TaxID=2040274 RepID=UPI0039E7DF73